MLCIGLEIVGVEFEQIQRSKSSQPTNQTHLLYMILKSPNNTQISPSTFTHNKYRARRGKVSKPVLHTC